MTKTELVDALMKEAGSEMTKKDTKEFLGALTMVVEKTLKKGGDVPLSGLGKFKVQHRKARIGRNPQTGESIKIPAKKVVKFTVAKNLKDTVLKNQKAAAKKTKKK
ncbi:MAG: HU family DNA-binding protein [Candidatus Eisenbacteria bacterium]|uniref:HU family DNA-binding protein n=1 Tax=Eiseniibacteriota bacterium TaxID=2212470 RepID=A0A956LXG9_UNCEI|nr:HU family DNA-binding protein [Candidatus Eisenbacteria bacterium]